MPYWSDGTVFQGESTGAAGLTVGEVVHTIDDGVIRKIHDPLLHGAAPATLTCAHIGNVGSNL